MRRSNLLSAALLALFVAGCAGDEGADVDPAVELGFYRAGGYDHLADGGTFWVNDAVQGGYWAMPAVRTQGLADEAEVSCVVREDNVGELGSESTYRFFEEAEGGEDMLEIKQFLVPLAVVDDPMYASLPGQTGEITCSVHDDDGGEIDIALDVVFDTEVGSQLPN